MFRDKNPIYRIGCQCHFHFDNCSLCCIETDGLSLERTVMRRNIGFILGGQAHPRSQGAWGSRRNWLCWVESGCHPSTPHPVPSPRQGSTTHRPHIRHNQTNFARLLFLKGTLVSATVLKVLNWRCTGNQFLNRHDKLAHRNLKAHRR